jgi:hypothetical protein
MGWATNGQSDDSSLPIWAALGIWVHDKGKRSQPTEVRGMRHSTLFPDEFRDLLIGVIALLLTLLIWSVLLTPAAI